VFRGATAVNLDTKGRLAIPTRYRAKLESDEGQMVCTIDLHNRCLLLYPLAEWEVIEEKLAKLSSMNPAERRIQRLLLGHASECQMDNAGRILIASTLRSSAGLTKNIMLVGQFNKFEVWDEEVWHAQIQAEIELEQAGDSVMNERILDLSL